MSTFSFVSQESFVDDNYVSEAVTLCFDGKYRVTYLRKKNAKGGHFWSEINAGVTKDGSKKYLKSFAVDSSFLQDDIKHFLENRSWEVNAQTSTQVNKHANTKAATGGNLALSDQEIPF